METPSGYLFSLDCSIDNEECQGDHTDGQPPFPLQLSIAYNLVQRTAWFRVRALISSVNTKKSSGDASSVYLDISPGQIASLDYDQPPRPLREPTPTPLGNRQTDPCIRLRFRLLRSATFIVPVDLEDFPTDTHTEADRRLLQLLHTASQQNALVIRLHSSTTLSQLPELASLCSAASTPGRLAPDPRLNPQRLYRGQGGRVVSAERTGPSDRPTAALAPVDGATESPPSYDDLAASPPPLPPKDRSGKRRRTSAPGSSCSSPVSHAHSLQVILADVERQARDLRALLQEAKTTEVRVTQVLATEESLREHLDSQLKTIREELVACMDDKLAEYTTSSEMEELISEQLDLHSIDTVTRTELEEFVEERLEIAGQELRERITTAFND